MNGKQGNWKTAEKRVSYETSGIRGIAGDTPWSLIAAWVAYVAMVACNFAFESLRLGGVTTAEVSNQVFVWFAPAGYAFAIWGFIYLALGVWLVALTNGELRYGRSAKTPCLLFVATCALNVAWLALFHFQHIALSLAIIIVYWGVVALLYANVQVPGKKLILRAPISLYLGWLSVASIINATNLMTRAFGSIAIVDEVSTILLSLVVLSIGFAMAKLAKDYIYPAVLLWATVAVGVHLIDVNVYVAAAVFTMCALGALATYLPVERLKLRKKDESTRVSQA